MIRYIERKHIYFFHKNLGTFHKLINENLDLQSKVNGRVYKSYASLVKLFRRI